MSAARRVHGRWWVTAAAAAATVLALGFARLRTRRVVRVSSGHDVAALLQGALQRPEAFRQVPSLYQRRLLPLLDGRYASLAEAWKRTEGRRLFRSARGSPWALGIATGGAWVLDARRPEGRCAADALGAVDLDDWEAFLKRSRRTALLAAVARALQRLGESWEVHAVPGLVETGVLDLPDGGHARRIVAVGSEEPWLVAAERRFAKTPHEAVLIAVDALARRLGLADSDRRRLLPPLARAANREAGA